MKDKTILHGEFVDFINYNGLIITQSSMLSYNPTNGNKDSMKKIVTSRRKYRRNKKKTRRLK